MTNHPGAEARTQQGTHHFVLTRQIPIDGGTSIATWNGHLTPADGMTRYDIYQWLLAEHDKQEPQFRGSTVLFFALEPNQL
ncbi:hypothetical protein [Streptomyces sp. SBT349]|uniref:hypothetical protein n=1 Tax=Streptomyces sp. SBT349 TaxID=1580539 RepID=UPI00066DB187|nr:hypothetical protein [Streptomyces sp. SBT349]